MITLEVTNLCCIRGDRPLFRELSWVLESGQLLHIVGHNGSGKTTLLRTLCGLSRPAEGTIKWQGSPIKELGDNYCAQIGYVGHANGIQGDLSALENLRFSVSLAGGGGTHCKSIADALELLGLAAHSHLPVKALSQGQKRRLALARLIVTEKPLWILDEPFTALDTTSIQKMEALVHDHLSRSGLVILTSHQPISFSDAEIQTLDLELYRA